MLSRARDAYRELRDKGVSEAIIANTAGEIKVLLLDGVKIHRSGFFLGSAYATDEEGAYTTVYTETDTYYEGYGVDQSTARVEKIFTSWTPHSQHQ